VFVKLITRARGREDRVQENGFVRYTKQTWERSSLDSPDTQPYAGEFSIEIPYYPIRMGKEVVGSLMKKVKSTYVWVVPLEKDIYCRSHFHFQFHFH
jgi:hypothetical protein